MVAAAAVFGSAAARAGPRIQFRATTTNDSLFMLSVALRFNAAMNCQAGTKLGDEVPMELLEPSATCIESCDASVYAFMAPARKAAIPRVSTSR